METLTVGRAKLTWLNGGVTHLDGGAMFGVVPKALWTKKYPYNEDNNQIELRCDAILLQIDGRHMLIDSGIGNNKLTDKQKRNFGVKEESKVEESLQQLNITVDQIDTILMTHLHFDHACGLTRYEGDQLVSTFPNAVIYCSKVEWDEMREPNMRSKNTYWEENWRPIESQVKPFDKEIEIVPGLKMHHTSGHSDGHSVIHFDDGDESFMHMADLMPTHGHQNPLWVLAYDDYPVTSVHEKDKWQKIAYNKKSWFTFYHDAYYRAIKYDDERKMKETIERVRYEYE